MMSTHTSLSNFIGEGKASAKFRTSLRTPSTSAGISENQSKFGALGWSFIFAFQHDVFNPYVGTKRTGVEVTRS